tara:strand:- start:56 stop:463 length:408 start_codon:yes stop_codon:yes gene_type:complete
MRKDKGITTAWVIFPEYTQWENKDNKLFWDEDYELEAAADAAVKHSWKKPIMTRKWPRPITFGDFVLATNSRSSEWFKMVECKGCNGYEWETSSWGEVFGDEAETKKNIREYLKEVEKKETLLDNGHPTKKTSQH